MISLALALMTASAPAHSALIEHRGTPVALTWRADTRVEHRQIGSVAPAGAPQTLRCAWTATVSVHRTAAQGGDAVHALTRRLDPTERLTGSRPGSCRGAEPAIAREIALRADTVRDHLIEVAEQDRARVVAELDSVGGLG